MDRGLWITWYDLPEKGREAYFNWLHGDFIPRILERPGVLWAAHYKVDRSVVPLSHLRHVAPGELPDGNDYVLIFGALDAHAFAGLTSYKFTPELSAKDREMLAMRRGERVAIYTEEARADGPDAHRREGGLLLAPCIQLGSFNSGSYKDEDELLSWYAHFRLPSTLTLPSAIGIRKLVSVSGWAKHGIIYEFTSREDREKNFRAHEAKFADKAAWTHDVVVKLLHAPGSPVVAERIWPPVKKRAAS